MASKTTALGLFNFGAFINSGILIFKIKMPDYYIQKI